MSRDENMTHDECSELLLPYSQGELGGEESARVEGHLQACGECSEELAGLRALLAPAGGGLDDLERRRLHARVAEQVAPSSLTRSSGAGERAARWFGAAALLVLLAVGVATVGSDLFDGAGGEAEDAGISAESADEPGAAESAPDALRDAAGPTPLFEVRYDVKEGFEANDTTGAPESVDVGEGDTELAGGDRRAKVLEFVSGRTLWQFSNAYSGSDAPDLQAAFIRRLSDQAPPESRADVVACAEQAAESQPYPLLPAYGTIDQRTGRPMLVLVFVWSDQGASALDHYQVWRWPLGNCETPPQYESGVIRER